MRTRIGSVFAVACTLLLVSLALAACSSGGSAVDTAPAPDGSSDPSVVGDDAADASSNGDVSAPKADAAESGYACTDHGGGWCSCFANSPSPNTVRCDEAMAANERCCAKPGYPGIDGIGCACMHVGCTVPAGTYGSCFCRMLTTGSAALTASTCDAPPDDGAGSYGICCLSANSTGGPLCHCDQTRTRTCPSGETEVSSCNVGLITCGTGVSEVPSCRP